MLTGSYDLTFVILSIVIAAMASYAALDLAGRVTAAAGSVRIGWLAGGATVMGLGIWSMHFVGMLAFHLPHAIAYQVPLMLLSVVVAIAASLLALAVVSRSELGIPTLAVAGLLMGAAIAGMHYVGMSSMYVAGARLTYDQRLVALSIVIAIVASLAALWLAFRFRTVTSFRGRALKFLAAIVMGMAISGMHYTGMAGARFHLTASVAPPGSYVLATGQLGAAVGVGAMLIIVLALVGAVIDRSIHARAAFTMQLAETNARLQQSLDEAERAHREREASEQALRASEEQLRQSQKMEAIGNLAGGIAHDFNNLLTVIRLNAELLLPDLPADRHEDHRELMNGVDRATSLTRQLLAYGRRQLLNPTPVSLNDIVRGTDSMLRRVIPEDIEIRSDLSADDGFALVDRGQIEQVILNLVVNARDAMPKGGRLLLETQNVTLESGNGHHVRSLPHGEYVTLAVRDTGVGMTPEVRDRALEPFFTTKAPGKGSGLGLSMAYGLVRQSSGDLTIESEPGAGTTVRIFLPRVASARAPRSTVTDQSSGCPANATILLVEDEASVRRATCRLLQQCGYTIHEAENGQDALDRHLHRINELDLLLTDLVMPQMGGIELLRELRTRRADIKALFMSGYSDDALGDARDLLAPLIQKPFAPGALTAAVRSVLGRDAVRPAATR